MTKFEKPGSKDWDYPDMGKEAATKALADAGIPYAAVEQACVGYVYGDSTCGKSRTAATAAAAVAAAPSPPIPPEPQRVPCKQPDFKKTNAEWARWNRRYGSQTKKKMRDYESCCS